MKDQIAEFIKAKREEAGISRYRLAQLSGCGQMMIARIENGENAPNLVLFIKICKALNASESDITKFYNELKEK